MRDPRRLGGEAGAIGMTGSFVTVLSTPKGDYIHFHSSADDAMKDADAQWYDLGPKERGRCSVIAAKVDPDSFGENGDFLEILWDSGSRVLSEWRGMKTVRMSGTSYTVAITEACRALGVERGDMVEITVRKVRCRRQPANSITARSAIPHFFE